MANNCLFFEGQTLIDLILICGTNAGNAVLFIPSDRLKNYHFLHSFFYCSSKAVLLLHFFYF